MMKKNCKVCGEEFFQPKKHGFMGTASGAYIKFCSPKCREISYKDSVKRASAKADAKRSPSLKGERAEERKRNPKLCVVCGDVLTAIRAQKYCGKAECRKVQRQGHYKKKEPRWLVMRKEQLAERKEGLL
jgi:predicted nucleic acid-binding Zn ribbon protein